MSNEKNIISYPESNSLEENAKIWAEHYNKIIEPGHGLFIDFSQVPEFEKPCVDYIMLHFGWIREKSYFLRKPENVSIDCLNLN